MKRSFFDFIKRPRGVFLVLLYLLTAGAIAGSVLCVALPLPQSIGFIAYILYALAAVLLAYTVYTIVIYVPVLKQKATERLKRHAFTANLLEKYDFKTTVFSVLSLVLSIAFAVMNLVSAVMYRSVWFGALAGYYFVLILFRGGVIGSDIKCKKKFRDDENGYERSKWKIYLWSGAFLVLLEVTMAIAVTQMVLSERPTQSGMIMAISNAAYTFYKLVMSIVNLIKAKKNDNPVTQSLRNLNFADACMSMVSLTVLMIATFGEDATDTSMLFMKAAVGFAACVAIIVIASCMIIKADKNIKKLKEEENGRTD